MSVITIIAGGWSASLIDLHKVPGTVIAVNDSAIYAPRVDIVVSMDRLWTENRYERVAKMGKPLHLRRSTLRNIERHNNDVLLPFECDHTSTVLSDERGRLNGTHSGFCALNLAYKMRPRELYLVGFDMARGPKGEQHWYPPYPWAKNSTGAARLAEWGRQFKRASEQLLEAGIITYMFGGADHLRWTPFVMITKRNLEGRCQVAA